MNRKITGFLLYLNNGTLGIVRPFGRDFGYRFLVFNLLNSLVLLLYSFGI